MGSSDQPVERATGAEQDIVDDLLRRGYLAVAVVPGHFHQREDLGYPTRDFVIAAERSDDPRPPLLEPFSAANWHPKIIPRECIAACASARQCPPSAFARVES